MFLQLLASANDVFYMSYLGADPHDGSAREPSVLVHELLDVAAGYHADAAQTRKRFVVRHPLQPFCAEAFGVDGDGIEPRRFSYRGEWQQAARTSPVRRRELPPWVGMPLPPPEPASRDVALTELAAFLRSPPDAFLRQRLQLRLPDPGAPLIDVEPLVLEHRAADALRDAVFDAQVTGRTHQLARRLRAQGLLPAGVFGLRVLDGVMDEVRPFAELFTGWRMDTGADEIGVELDLDDVRLHGRLRGVHPHGLARLRFGALNGPSQIAHGLDWLVACALGRALPLVQFAVHDARVDALQRDPVPPAQARAVLRALLALRDSGLVEPLPFGAYAGWAWYDGQDDRAWKAARERWLGTRAWAEGAAPAMQLTLRGRDPFAREDVAERFQQLARRVFDAVLHARAEIDA